MPKVDSEVRRSRGRPRKAAGEEKKGKKEIPTPNYATSFEAAKSFATMDFMLKQHAKGLKDLTKAKSDCQKILKAYFKGNPREDSIGPIECTRKEKKQTADLAEVKKAVEEEVMQDPHRAGEILARAISERIKRGKEGGNEEANISIKISKDFKANLDQVNMEDLGEDMDDDEDEDEDQDGDEGAEVEGGVA